MRWRLRLISELAGREHHPPVRQLDQPQPQPMVSLRQATIAVITTTAVLAAPTAASAAADFGQGVGLACAVDSDCGYLPSLACVHG